ncbi:MULTISPECIES: transcriptional regulator SdiA [Pantoea]|jgi:LuxR family transcriptional regulator|uniref:Transcriptional regulator SdiA n=1 Tax=Pantoea vagans TaxID=470934 RepID=A0AAN1TVE0_9GAMM|nr:MULTISPECIES: transcriptional regulator SdiA [Pantoea]AVV37311.1 transcriptional regulator SdiA [Pantoea vagans]MCJ7925486.1 transcriptional regulator SdiA [Pantoea vagans]PAW37017.1 transcriptional regulator SdiA [Pantoea vagans]PXW21830.1 LuxR family transcriptional regulator [Pantoea sp. JKS000250]TXL80941.1 transcriptional regulator SdiA [Pantoea vagans]
MSTENYFAWRSEVKEKFQALTASFELKTLLQQFTESLGFDYFAFLIQHPVPFTRPRIHLHSTYPKLWVKRYEKQNYYAVDPVLTLCQRPGRGMAWIEEQFTDAGNLWHEAREYGLQSGFSCSAMAPNRVIGILSISSQQPISVQLRHAELEVKLHLLAELSLDTLERFSDDAMMVLKKAFSQRELEILKWTAEGKTAVEISLILSISEHTVNFHQKNMQKRFNVSNKTQIACYAAAIGLI